MEEDHWVSKWSKERIRTLLLEQYDYFRGRDTGVPRENLAQKTTRDRELRALKGAMETLPGTRGLVLMDSDEEPLEWNDKSIRILSLSRWLLESPEGMGV